MLLDTSQWPYFLIGLVGYIAVRLALHFVKSKKKRLEEQNNPEKNDERK